MSSADEKIAGLERELQAAHEMLAAILYTEGPVEINLQNKLPAGAQIMIDDLGDGHFTLSLLVDHA